MFTRQFIDKVAKINIKHSTTYRWKYLSFKEEFRNEFDYNEELEGYLNNFRQELLDLPFRLNAKSCRKTYFNNLYDEFIISKGALNKQFEQILTRSFDCIKEQKNTFRFYYPRYLRKKYLEKARDAYQKICIAYNLQNDKIENAIEILTSYAINDGIDLKIMKEHSERLRTTLSSPELAFLSFVIFQSISEDPKFNRSLLSRIVSDNFSTKRSENPKASQIRKHFTEVNDKVKTNVKKILIELADAC